MTNLIFTLAGKDLRRRMRRPVGILVLIAIPIVISSLFGLVFSPSGKPTQPRVRYLLADQDKSMASQFFKGAFTNGELAKTVELKEVEYEEGLQLINAGKATVFLVIPEKFGNDLLDGRKVFLRLYTNPAERILPEIGIKITETMALLADYAAQLLGGPLKAARQDAEAHAEFPDATRWSGISLQFRDKIGRIQRYVMPPVIELKSETEKAQKKESDDFNYFAYFLPGMAMMSLLFLAETTMRDMLFEMKGGQLRRIFVSPATASQVLFGKLLFSFSVVFLAFLIMTAVGIACFGMKLKLPWIYLLGGFCASLACTGMMTLIQCLLGDERKNEAATSIVIVVMCMLGGSFVPLDSLPAFFQFPARFTVNFWSIGIMQKGLLGNASVQAALVDAAVLLGIALITLVPALLVLRRRMMRGIA